MRGDRYGAGDARTLVEPRKLNTCGLMSVTDRGWPYLHVCVYLRCVCVCLCVLGLENEKLLNEEVVSESSQ